jgi:membrane protein implicated in regulation of membrane protease activity
MSTTVVWATLGIALILLEVFTSTFVLLFFGVAALLVAGLKLLGLAHLALEIAIFGGLGMGLTLLLRNKIKASLGSRAGQYRSDELLYLDQDIAPGATASIAYQGTTWTAVNDSDRLLAKGSRAVIARTEGVKLFLKPCE